ncbi:MAG: hypothetical protein U0X92_11575 [Anaerolineales bacterium]
MNFNTALFLFLFLPFFLLTYFFAQPRWRPIIGILASLLFYAWGDAVNLVWILLLILFNYWLGRLFDSKPAKWILPFGLLVNVGVLIGFKVLVTYGDNFLVRYGELLPARASNWLDTVTFPLGLSYISFQLISYLLDVKKGAVKSEKSLVAFAFYILLFPKLLVGPIVRYRALAEQLLAPTLNPQQIADSARRFCSALRRKFSLPIRCPKSLTRCSACPLGS